MNSITELAKQKNCSKTDVARKYFEEHGCKLLDEYTGTYVKMKYICRCGKESSICWNKFTQGRRCGHCGKNGRTKKYSQEEVENLFKERGCELLDKYTNNTTKVNYRCKCGQIAEITPNAFIYQNQTCHDCGIKKNSGPNHAMWEEDREALKLRQSFRKRCYKLLRKSRMATGQCKKISTEYMLGYSPKELQEHIMKHPNWEKCKHAKWHVDHIFPIKAFLDNGITDLKVINHLSNLQPLPMEVNISKGDWYDQSKFVDWLVAVGIKPIHHSFFAAAKLQKVNN